MSALAAKDYSAAGSALNEFRARGLGSVMLVGSVLGLFVGLFSEPMLKIHGVVPVFFSLYIPTLVRTYFGGVDATLRLAGQIKFSFYIMLASAASLVVGALIFYPYAGLYSVAIAMTVSSIVLNTFSIKHLYDRLNIQVKARVGLISTFMVSAIAMVILVPQENLVQSAIWQYYCWALAGHFGLTGGASKYLGILLLAGFAAFSFVLGLRLLKGKGRS
jgi:O-antigen/teichoic acid export membrane protein